MSSSPFDISIVVEKLESLLADKTLAFIGTQAEYSKFNEAISITTPTPAAYVLLNKEKPNGKAAGGRQSVNVKFSVVIVVSEDESRAKNFKNIEQMANPIISTVRNLLIGETVQFTDGARPVSWAGGKTLGFQNGALSWIDSFKTQHFIGKR